MGGKMRNRLKESVRQKYGKIATSGGSCCPSCGCGGTGMTAKGLYSEDDLGMIPKESMMGLGCGNPLAFADLKPGEVVLDLGSGGGADVFLAARRVGEKGKVIGVDISDEMLERARRAAFRNGFTNVEFRKGDIESLPIEDGSVDVVISNCVINLSTDKGRVFREISRVLKPGGRMVVSDNVTKGGLPEHVRKSPDAWAACVGGAIDKRTYLGLITESGLVDVRILAEFASTGLPTELDGKLASITVYATKPRA